MNSKTDVMSYIKSPNCLKNEQAFHGTGVNQEILMTFNEQLNISFSTKLNVKVVLCQTSIP